MKKLSSIVAISIFVLFMVASAVVAEQSRVEMTISYPEAQTYTVKRGDTLTAIAERYGLSQEDLIKSNPIITNKNAIKRGTQIKIPLYSEPPQVKLAEPVKVIVPPSAVLTPTAEKQEGFYGNIWEGVPYWGVIGIGVSIMTLLAVLFLARFVTKQTKGEEGKQQVLPKIPLTTNVNSNKFLRPKSKEMPEQWARRIKSMIDSNQIDRDTIVTCQCGFNLKAKNALGHVNDKHVKAAGNANVT